MDSDIKGAIWRKSSYSGDNGGACIEVAGNLSGIVAVRDSKNPSGPALTFTPSDWRGFVTAIKAGDTCGA